MPGELLFTLRPEGLLFATFVHHRTPATRAVWAAVERTHVRTVRGLLERACVATERERVEPAAADCRWYRISRRRQERRTGRWRRSRGVDRAAARNVRTRRLLRVRRVHPALRQPMISASLPLISWFCTACQRSLR